MESGEYFRDANELSGCVQATVVVAFLLFGIMIFWIFDSLSDIDESRAASQKATQTAEFEQNSISSPNDILIP